MESNSKFIKYLLVLQIFVVFGIGICEVVQLAEIKQSQSPIINHPEDWNYLIGYTDSILIIIMKIYYWIVILISFGILGWSWNSFEKRWDNIQKYSDNSRNILLLVLWCAATIPNIILLSSSAGIRTCSQSSYSYALTPRLLRQCNTYLASLLLAYILVFMIIIQLLFHVTIIKHQKRLSIKPPLQEPKKLKVRRSKRVSKKKRSSLRSSAAFSVNSTRLSIVTEDDEEKSSSYKSGRSGRSAKSDEIVKFNNEKGIHLNV